MNKAFFIPLTESAAELSKKEVKMEVFAQGKNIPTYSFGRMFVQGEHCADKITFMVDKNYSGNDLSECNFSIIGISDGKWEICQILTPVVCNDKIKLEWTVSNNFTQNSGKLELELRASKNDSLILKYDMQPVYVKPALNGENAPLPDASDQIISDITAAAVQGIEDIDDAKNAALGNLQQKMDEFGLEATEERLDKMEADTAVYLARPEVVALTREEYESITVKADSLYVIVTEG